MITAVMDLNGIDIFLGYDQLFKHNPEVNWNTRTIQFTRYPKKCRIQYQNVSFTSRTKRLQLTDNQNKG